MNSKCKFTPGQSQYLLFAVWLLVGVLFLSAAWARAAEAGVQAWVRRYGHTVNSMEDARRMVTDNAGNVIVVGTTDSGGGDILVIKYSGAGVLLWTNWYHGPGNSYDSAQAVAVDGSGNVFVTGYSYAGGRSADYATVKYSGAGVPVWTNLYNGPENTDDVANAVGVDGSGNVFVTGYSHGGGIFLDYTTIKYSGAGMPLWTNRYNGPGNNWDFATAVAVDGSGNVFVTGYSHGGGSFFDYATIKYSGAGMPLWTNRYNGPGNSGDYASAVVVDGNGNVFVTGRSSGNASFFDYATIKYSGLGMPLWTNCYNGPGNSDDIPYAVAVDGSGSVFVTGDSYGSSGVDRDYATIAYSGAGLSSWTNRYNGPEDSDDSAQAVAVDDSGNVFVTGYSYGSGGTTDYATIKYSGAGVLSWSNRYNNTYGAQSLALGLDGSVYVTGTADGDFVTIKYIPVPVLGIDRSATEVVLSWPTAFSNFVLQGNTDLATTNWSNVVSMPTDNGTNWSVTVPGLPVDHRFYRLKQ